jgi:hypothetical protein
MKPILPLPILGWTTLVFVASFLNWARIPFGRTLRHINGQDPLLTLPSASLATGLDGFHQVTAWTAHYSFLGVELPLWLVCVAALLVGVVSLLKAFGAMTPEAARRTACAAAVAGFLHVAGFLWLMLMLGASLGLGVLATATGMFALSVLVIRRDGPEAARAAASPCVESAPQP